MTKMEFVNTEIGHLPREWGIKRLSEVSETQDFTANGSFASLKENVKYRDTPSYAILIRLTDFNRGFAGNFVYIDEDAYKFLKKSSLKPKDLIISNIGAYAGTVFLAPNLDKPMSLGPNAITIKNTPCPDFLFYWLKSPAGQEVVSSIKTGSAVPKFNKTDLRNIYVPQPPLSEQKAIAKILGGLDEKIDVNNRMNKTLESMGQALFKRWFIDFEFPNGQGCSYKSSGGKMVDSAFGKIPINWHISTMPEIADIIDCLHTKKPERVESTEYILLQLNNIGDRATIDLADKYGVSKKDYLEWAKNIEVTEGDCIITNAGLVGAIARIPAGLKSGIGRNFTAIRPKKILPVYLFSYLMSEYGKTEIAGNEDQGTIFNSLNVKGIKKIKVLIPDDQVLNNYEDVSAKLRNIVEANVLQNQSLTELRDSLLPKLMSGEIRVG